MPEKKTFIIEALSVIAIVAVLWLTRGHGISGRPHFKRSSVTITRADGRQFPFATEVAATPQEQAYGLMFVRALPENAGMIFPYNPPRAVEFWMENTFIPLDIIFVRPDGRIGRIAADARPQDVTPIPSQGPVIAVVEINGGLAKKDGFAAGDKVDSPVIRPTAAP